MPLSLATIAVVSSSPALASILAAAMRHRNSWHVRSFTSLRELGTYMRIAPVAVIVSDYELADGTISDFASSIRQGDLAAPDGLSIIALARAITADLRRECLASSVDELIVKPMSPAYIEERVEARLRAQGHPRMPESEAPEIAGWRGSNVISFAAHRAAREAALSRP